MLLLLAGPIALALATPHAPARDTEPEAGHLKESEGVSRV
jgi:hypothetical protein